MDLIHNSTSTVRFNNHIQTENPSSPKNAGVATEPKDQVQIGGSDAPEKELTILFYNHGQYDDIGKHSANTMFALEQGGGDGNVNVVTQLGRNPYKPEEEGEFHLPVDGDWAGIRRYAVTQDDHKGFEVTKEQYLEITEKIPDNPYAYYCVADICMVEGDIDTAMEYYAKSRELGMMELVKDYYSPASKVIRDEFDAVCRPFEEMTADHLNYASKIEEVLPETAHMGQPETLEKFVEWGMKKYPAKHYALVVMGHGGAWIGAAEQSPADMNKAISKGISTANAETGRNDKLDILSFNSCYMGNLEAVYEVRKNADITIASENYGTTAIFSDWSHFLKDLRKDLSDGKSFDGKEFATKIVDYYRKENQDVKEYTPDFAKWKESFTTLSAVDNRKLDALAGSFSKFVESCNSKGVSDKVLFGDVEKTKDYDSSAPNPSRFFGFYDTIRDLGSFMKRIGKNPEIPDEVKDKAKNVLKTLKDSLVAEQHEGPRMGGSNGLTFWGPSNGVDIAYMGKQYGEDVGQFAKDSGWRTRLMDAYNRIPPKLVSGFLDITSEIKELKKALQAPGLSEEEKTELKAKIDQASRNAVEYKKKLDFTVEREADIFLSRGGPRPSLTMSGQMGKDFVDEAVARGRFA